MSDNLTQSTVQSAPTAPKRNGLISRAIASIGGPGIKGNVPIVVIGAVLGLIAGYLLGGLDSGTYSSTTVVNGNVVGTSTPPELTSSDIIGTYTATELSYFGYLTKQMQAEIASQTGQPSKAAPIAIVEKGTALLDITASGSSAEQSVKASTIAANTYIADWRTRTVASINQQIAATQATLNKLGANAPGAAALQGQLAAQYYDLTATQTAPRLVRPATVETATFTSAGTTIAILGALVGLMAGLGVLLMFRRRRSAD